MTTTNEHQYLPSGAKYKHDHPEITIIGLLPPMDMTGVWIESFFLPPLGQRFVSVLPAPEHGILRAIS